MKIGEIIVSEYQFYESYKKVKIGCHDCEGCSACCSGMGNSIILDPWDFYHLEKGLSKQPAALLDEYAQLHVSEGLILPNLQMAGEKETCPFLNREGRCGIHGFRPGLCRLFPLGRNYEDGKLTYFILEDACRASGERTKVKIADWIGIAEPEQNEEMERDEEMERYEKFLTDWHYYLKSIRQKIAALPENEWESGAKNASMNILQGFYLKPYDCERDFYDQFYERLERL